MEPVTHFPVQIIYQFQETLTETRTFTPTSWRESATQLKDIRDKVLGPRQCIISFPVEASQNSSKEHAIPQASGIRWIELPKGLVSEDFNSKASAWELKFFKKGLLGSLRPWYVFNKKEVEFSDGAGKRVVLSNDPANGFKIKTFELKSLSQPLENGTLRLQLLIEHPPTRAASRSLTKLAYLVLTVVKPEIAFSEALDEARIFLLNDEAPYRPFGERFLPMQPPGVAVSYQIKGQHVEGNLVEITGLYATIVLHHVQYIVHLAGEPPDPPANGIDWYASDEPAQRRSSTITFGYSNPEFF